MTTPPSRIERLVTVRERLKIVSPARTGKSACHSKPMKASTASGGWGTLQDRLVNELRVARIRTLEAANRYLQQRFLPTFNATFGRAPADPTSAFVPVGRVDLEQLLCHEEARTVARNNTVVLDGVVLQIDKQRGRRTCAGLPVLVRRHLDGRHSVWWGPRCLGWFTAAGRALARPAA